MPYRENDNTKLIKHSITRFLSYREHSKCELHRKLTAKEYDPQLCWDWIEKFADQGLQSDERFTESFVRQKLAKGLGEARINAELSQHNIAKSVVIQVMKELQPDWFELAKGVFLKRFGAHPEQDLKAKQKQQRFMFYRGFNHEQVMYAMESAEI